MFRLCPIVSGSSGNCTYIQAGERKILIDIGISGKKLCSALQEIEVEPDAIEGIFITHEHMDHIKGVGIFSRKYEVPIYATQMTWDKLMQDNLIGKIKEEHQRVIVKDESLVLGELSVTPYSIHHDAVDPVGYVFEYQNKKIALTTDCGMIDEGILDKIKNVDGLLLEFNHDINMLEAGNYPFYLKKRILSDVGHLNNEDAATALVQAYHHNMKWVILGHLSKDNNVPDLAYITAQTALEENDIKVGEDVEVYVAKRDQVSKSFYV